MQVCARWWSPAPRGTLANCCHIQASVPGLCHLHSAALRRQSVVVFDGYGSTSSTKAAEQQRRATQSISADILFECDMKTITTQKAFLANSKNKARLIVKLTTELRHAGVIVKQDTADADHLIVSTAMTLAQTERKPVVVVGTDTDLLVMLVSQCSSDMDIHMLCHQPSPFTISCW